MPSRKTTPAEMSAAESVALAGLIRERLEMDPDRSLPKAEAILAEARAIIVGQKQEAYGAPIVNFGRIATVWSVQADRAVTPYEVAVQMAGMKMARLAHGYDRDSLLDAIAYLALAEQLTDNEEDGE